MVFLTAERAEVFTENTEMFASIGVRRILYRETLRGREILTTKNTEVCTERHRGSIMVVCKFN